MLIWIFQTGEPLHIDDAGFRPMRSVNLANSLIAEGHSVVIWTAAFNHVAKSHRSDSVKTLRVSENLEIKLIPSIGYYKNIGLRRLLDHAELAIRLFFELKKQDNPPDAAFVGYPPIEFAFVAIRWLKSRSVPSIIDVKDQWPSLFLEALPSLLRPFASIFFYPYTFLGKRAIRDASAACSMSDSFLQWVRIFGDRMTSPYDCVVPLSPKSSLIDNIDIAEAISWWKSLGVKDDGNDKVFFVGSLSQAFDFLPLAHAAFQASELGKNWQFVICGDGPERKNVERLFANFPNVVIPGWINRAKLVALSKISTVGIAPYKNTPNFTSNLPNKVIDYLSLGKPIISPLSGEVTSLIKNNRVGAVYGSSTNDDLYTTLENLFGDRQELLLMSSRALKIYEFEFSGDIVYKKLSDIISQMAAKG